MHTSDDERPIISIKAKIYMYIKGIFLTIKEGHVVVVVVIVVVKNKQ